MALQCRKPFNLSQVEISTHIQKLFLCGFFKVTIHKEVQKAIGMTLGKCHACDSSNCMTYVGPCNPKSHEILMLVYLNKDDK